MSVQGTQLSSCRVAVGSQHQDWMKLAVLRHVMVNFFKPLFALQLSGLAPAWKTLHLALRVHCQQVRMLQEPKLQSRGLENCSRHQARTKFPARWVIVSECMTVFVLQLSRLIVLV